MPRTQIAEQNRTGEGGGLRTKLKLDKGEYARFVMLEQPWSEWVHSLRAPIIENGVVQKESASRRGRGGDGGERTKTEFIGTPLCLGNPDVLSDKGVDPVNCPVCAAAREDSNYKPARRYAANILQYTLRPGSWEPQIPLSFSVTVWSFTARMFDNLLDLANEIGELQRHDIRLECEDKQYQRMKLMFNIEPAWAKYGDQAENQTRMVQAWEGEGNRATDAQLKAICGTERSRSQMQEDIDFCVAQWRRAEAAGGSSPLDATGGSPLGGGGQPQSYNAGVASLLETPAPAAQPAQNGAPGGLDIFAPAAQAAPAAPEGADPLAGILPEPQAAPGASGGPAPVAATETASAGTQTAPPSEQSAAAPAPAAPSATFDTLFRQAQQ